MYILILFLTSTYIDFTIRTVSNMSICLSVANIKGSVFLLIMGEYIPNLTYLTLPIPITILC